MEIENKVSTLAQDIHVHECGVQTKCSSRTLSINYEHNQT